MQRLEQRLEAPCVARQTLVMAAFAAHRHQQQPPSPPLNHQLFAVSPPLFSRIKLSLFRAQLQLLHASRTAAADITTGQHTCTINRTHIYARHFTLNSRSLKMLPPHASNKLTPESGQRRNGELLRLGMPNTVHTSRSGGVYPSGTCIMQRSYYWLLLSF